jgi:2-polyprenyl-3-methyl-5-hydroxy-6-metoxy-1,4-benzoquinol methylase
MKSPLSEQPPHKLRDLSGNFLLQQLEEYYGEKPPAAAVEGDYSLWKCSETGLEFAWPMRPGNACFYEWVSQFDSYYPGVRWEYGEVRRAVESANGAEIPRVLDVGCGKGDFLRGLVGVPAGNKYALDMNEPAVKACRELGFRSFCGTVETASKAGFLSKSQFPVVTAFHCLEHVDDPLKFVSSLLEVVAPGGRLFLSTPYSPMSFEADWFDVLNHPPHHMTRWNQKAYQKIADLLGAQMRWVAPRSSALRRTLNEFRLLRYGPNRRVAKPKLLADLLADFPNLVRRFARQRQRGKGGGIAADVILAEFTPPE